MNFPNASALKPKSNIQDVAKLAQVSAMTVSRVINNHPRVSKETADRVRAAIAEVDYSPMPSLRKRGRPSRAYLGIHSGQVAMATIGMSKDVAHNPVIERTLAGISSALAEKKLYLIHVHLDPEARIPDSLDRRNIDGLIISGAIPADGFLEELGDLPMVSLYQFKQKTEQLDSVKPNNAKIAQMAADNIWEAGHRSCAFFNPSPGHREFAERHLYFKNLIEKKGGTCHSFGGSQQVSSSGTITQPDMDPQLFDPLITEFLAMPNRPKALFLPSDLITANLHRQLRERGEDPAHFHMVSCNHEKPYLEGLFPQPEVIDIQAELIGRRAAEMLLQRIAEPQKNNEELLIEPRWRDN